MVEQQEPLTPSDFRKVIEPDQSLFKFSIISLIGSVISLAIAAALLYSLVINGSNRQLTSTVYQSHADTYAGYFNQKVGQLQNHLLHISQQTSTRDALQNFNPESLLAIRDELTRNIPDLININLLPFGSAKLSADKNLLSFREIDMINNAEVGARVPAEVDTSRDIPVLRLVQAVKAENTDAVVGVILASFSLDALSNQLERFDAQYGSIKLIQSFRGNSRTIIQRGEPFNDEQLVLSVELNNPNWRLQFQPSVQLAQENTLSRAAFWAPLAFAFFAICLSILVAYVRLRQSVRNDAVTLVSYCRSLIERSHEKTPRFSLSLFGSMAKTLEYSQRENVLDDNARFARKRAEQKQAEQSAEVREQNQEALNAEILDDDILDLDLVGFEAEAGEPAADEQPAETPTEQVIKPDVPLKPVPAGIFRAYDIRGIVDETLDTDIAYRIGQAVGTEAAIKGEHSVVVGADGRLSSPELCAALIQGLRDTGRNVINIGTVPTPVVYFATHNLQTKSGVMITGSHNPSNYNGFKIVIAGETLANESIQALHKRIEENKFVQGSGLQENVDIVDSYIERIVNDIAIAKPLKVVVDCGNGVASVVGPRLLEDLGCEVIPLYCEIDGRFPNHHPDPGKPENLQEVIAAVAEHNADIGLAFDGDGDRLGVVTNAGNIIWPDRLLMLFAKDVASRNPGADIIYDVKCSRRLSGLISEYGCRPIMWKTGHSLIKAKMRETGALLAGEMSGHIFFKERWFGFDDGIYSAARLLEILGTELQDAEQLFESFPDDLSTPEINIEVTEESKFEIVRNLQEKAEFDEGDISTIDGVRVDFENGWGLVRASNTTPVLVLRFGAEDAVALEQIQNRFKKELLAVEPNLAIPF